MQPIQVPESVKNLRPEVEQRFPNLDPDHISRILFMLAFSEDREKVLASIDRVSDPHERNMHIITLYASYKNKQPKGQ